MKNVMMAFLVWTIWSTSPELLNERVKNARELGAVQVGGMIFRAIEWDGKTYMMFG